MNPAPDPTADSPADPAMRPLVLPFGGKAPRIDPTAVLMPRCTVVGDVEIGPETSVWFGVTMRGDDNPIRIGARCSIQENVLIHLTEGLSSTVVGDGVTVGHCAVLHGCRVGNYALVGMGAIVLDNAEVGEEAMVGAQSLVPPGMKIPPRTLAVGVPARVKRDLTEDEVRRLHDSAAHYVELSAKYRKEWGALPLRAPRRPSR